jgi:hypothetical protein
MDNVSKEDTWNDPYPTPGNEEEVKNTSKHSPKYNYNM